MLNYKHSFDLATRRIIILWHISLHTKYKFSQAQKQELQETKQRLISKAENNFIIRWKAQIRRK